MKTLRSLFSKPWFSISIAIAFTLLVLYLVFKDNYVQIIEMIQTIHPIWFLILMALVMSYHLFIGWNLKILVNARHIKYSMVDGFINALIASFGHGVTPSASGGQVFQMYVFRRQKVNAADAAGALWADFIIYQITMVVVFFLLIVLRFNYFRSNFSNLFLVVLLGFVVNSAVILVLLVGVKSKRIYNAITHGVINLLVKLHILKNGQNALDNLNLQLNSFKECADEFCNQPIIIAKCVALQVARLLLYYAIPFFVYLSMDIRPIVDTSGAMLLLDCICLTAYVSMINAFIPIPGASGGTEAIFVLMFSTLFGNVQAGAIMALWRLFTYYLIMVIGALTFILFKHFYHRGDDLIDPTLEEKL